FPLRLRTRTPRNHENQYQNTEGQSAIADQTRPRGSKPAVGRNEPYVESKVQNRYTKLAPNAQRLPASGGKRAAQYKVDSPQQRNKSQPAHRMQYVFEIPPKEVRNNRRDSPQNH